MQNNVNGLVDVSWSLRWRIRYAYQTNEAAETQTGATDAALFIYLFIYLLRPKAAQHNITITKTEETHKKLKK